MKGKLYWIMVSVVMFGLFQTSVKANIITDPLTLSFGTGHDIGASLDDVLTVAMGDLDNDGDLDVVSGSGSAEDNELIAWQNDGTPFSGLWTQNDVGLTSNTIASVAFGDLDNDGDLDIVSGDFQGLVVAWQNDGTPFTGTWTSIQVADQAWSVRVALGDLDNDGDLDIVGGSDSTEDYEVSSWQNDGTPFSGSWTQNDVGASSDTVNSVALGDLDNDGDLDIVSGSSTGEDYEVIAWRNDGTPFNGYWTPNDVGTPNVGTYPNPNVHSVTVGDLDSDGDLDIVSGNSWQAAGVIVWQNDGTPFSGFWDQHSPGSIVDTTYSVAVGDLDNDGDLDIVAGVESTAGNEVPGLENDGTPFSGTWTVIEVGHSDSDVNSVAVGDLDNDGDLDVVTGSDSGEDYEVISCPNTITHSPLPLGFPNHPLGTTTDAVYSVAAGDLDHDGDLDLVSGSTLAEDYEIIAWENDRTPFDGTWNQTNVGAAENSIYDVALGDLDNDGDLDVVSVGSSLATYEILVWKNNGTPFSGTWDWNNVGTSTVSVWEVSLGDLDNDGDLDLATMSKNKVVVWQNDGTPFADPWTPNDVGTSTADVISLELGDLDNDGDLDVVSGSETDEDYELIAWRNDGTPFTGLWTPNDIGASLAYINSVTLGDLDKDGDLDVVSGGNIHEDYEVIAWQNDGSPFSGYWTQNDVGASDAHISCVALGDLDNDGDLDIASTSKNGDESEVVVWENDDTPFSGLWNRIQMGAGQDYLYTIELADLDNDGDLDLVTGSNDEDASFEIIAWQNGGSLQTFIPIIFKNP